jgi:biotin--protein ligase
MRVALIYDGPGAVLQSVAGLRHHLALLGVGTKSVAAAALDDWATFAGVWAFFMPGGPSSQFRLAISAIGVNNIRRFVRDGGKYFGFCGGAYYACKAIIFTPQNGDARQSDQGNLELVPLTASGPFTGNYREGDECGAAAVEIRTEKETLTSYCNGGCYFSDEEVLAANGAVLAHYGKVVEGDWSVRSDGEGKVAICEIPCGRGTVYLSGAHLEYHWEKKLEADAWDGVGNDPSGEDSKVQWILTENGDKGAKWFGNFLRSAL